MCCDRSHIFKEYTSRSLFLVVSFYLSRRLTSTSQRGKCLSLRNKHLGFDFLSFLGKFSGLPISAVVTKNWVVLENHSVLLILTSGNTRRR